MASLMFLPGQTMHWNLDRWILGLNSLGWRTAEIAEHLGYSYDHIKLRFSALHFRYGTSDKLELAMLYLKRKGDLSA